MAIPKGTKQTPHEGRNEIELVPDAWPRFEKFIREIVKSGPQHRAPPGKPKEKAGKSHKQKKAAQPK